MPNFFFRHAILTTIVVLTALGLVVFVTAVTFTNPPDIPMGTATALATVYGFPAAAIALYKWRSEKGRNDSK